MFVFGDPADAAKLHVDMYLDGAGPEVPDIHIDEMEEQDLRNLIAYLYLALVHGIANGLDEAMLDVVMEWYDEVFIALAEASERFRERVFDGSVRLPGGPAVRPRYFALAKEASES